MEELYLPVLHSFENNNVYTGNRGDFRFKVTPQVVMLTKKEVNLDESSIKAEFWHGEKCYEMSEIESERVFPMSAEGRQALIDWLIEQIAQDSPNI